MFLHVGLCVKTGIVILLEGGAASSPQSPACVYIYIEFFLMFLHVALPVKTGIVILLDSC